MFGKISTKIHNRFYYEEKIGTTINSSRVIQTLQKQIKNKNKYSLSKYKWIGLQYKL